MTKLQTYRGVYLWQYVPNLAASIVLCVLFGVLVSLHAWRMFRTKTWFWSAFITGGILEVLGYMSRALSFDRTGSLALFIIQGIFLLLPPIFFAASMYMVYSRIVRSVPGGPAFSPIPLRWTTRLFVFGDFVCLNIQGNGAGLTANPDRARIGNWIVVVGLIFQVLLFMGFAAMCILFHRRYERHLVQTGASCDAPWTQYLHVLYWTSAAILLRNIYRVVEYIMGDKGYLMRTEWPTFVFDAALMLLTMILYAIWYPGGILPLERNSMIELTSDETLSKYALRKPSNRVLRWVSYTLIFPIFLPSSLRK